LVKRRIRSRMLKMLMIWMYAAESKPTILKKKKKKKRTTTKTIILAFDWKPNKTLMMNNLTESLYLSFHIDSLTTQKKGAPVLKIAMTLYTPKTWVVYIMMTTTNKLMMKSEIQTMQ
jgi:hypothetical protein